MYFFKADRLRMFITGNLFNSGKKVEVHTTKGKNAPKWLVVDRPTDAFHHVVHVEPPSRFAIPPGLCHRFGCTCLQVSPPHRLACTLSRARHADRASRAPGGP